MPGDDVRMMLEEGGRFLEDFSPDGPDVSKGLGNGQLVNSFRKDSRNSVNDLSKNLVWRSTRCI